MLDELKRLTARDGYLVLAGLLEQDVPEISGRLESMGLDRCQILDDNEWRTYIIRGA